MPIEPERSSVQSDPRNVASSNPQRIRASFWIVAIIFTALALTAMLIWVKG
jgi:hypothetical protein